MYNAETMWVSDIKYRESKLLSNSDASAFEILKKITNQEAQSIVLDNIASLSCISESPDGTIYFFVMSADRVTTTCYKVIGNSVVKKVFSLTIEAEPSGQGNVWFYGISDGESTIDLYYKTKEDIPTDIVNNFKDIEEREGFEVFYGFKLHTDGSRSRFKTYEMNSSIDEVTDSLLSEMDLSTLSSTLSMDYGT